MCEQVFYIKSNHNIVYSCKCHRPAGVQRLLGRALKARPRVLREACVAVGFVEGKANTSGIRWGENGVVWNPTL